MDEMPSERLNEGYLARLRPRGQEADLLLEQLVRPGDLAVDPVARGDEDFDLRQFRRR